MQDIEEKFKASKLFAAGHGIREATKELAKRLPIIAETIGGIEGYTRSLKEQSREQLLKYLFDKVSRLDLEIEEKIKAYSNSEAGKLFFSKAIESALNAEYGDKQEIFVNALLNGAQVNVLEDEKLRFIDLIRHLSRVALNVLSVVYEMYDRLLNDRTSSPQIARREVVSAARERFQYTPELTDSALRELKNMGLFSNVLSWHNPNGAFISEGTTISEDAFAYTVYTRRFIKFITDSTEV